MRPHSPCPSHGDHPSCPTPQLTLALPQLSHTSPRQADRRGLLPDRHASQCATRELREQQKSQRRFTGSHWQPLSNEQHRQLQQSKEPRPAPPRSASHEQNSMRRSVTHQRTFILLSHIPPSDSRHAHCPYAKDSIGLQNLPPRRPPRHRPHVLLPPSVGNTQGLRAGASK